MGQEYNTEIENDYKKISVERGTFDNGNLAFDDFFSTPPMFFTKNLANVPLENIHNGGHGFLISSGPSFKNINTNLLGQPGIFTIGLNNSPASFRPNAWTCVDSPSNFLASIWLDPKIQKIVPISHINKPLFDSSQWKDIKTTVGDCPNVIYYRRNEVVNTDQYLFEDTINWGNHSSVGGGRSVFMAAVRIAFLLGIRKLYLLGVDLHMDENNKYHFEQERNKGSINGNMTTYNSMKNWFSELKPYFDKVGFEVYNCNPDSALKAFPFISFEDAVRNATKDIPQNEKTDGMYTRNNDKKKEQEELKAKEVANKYTDEDREKAKQKLDELRKLLDGAKENQNQFLQSLFPDNSQECYLWAHKLKRPNNEIMAKMHDDVKEIMRNQSAPDNSNTRKLIELQTAINDARTNFRNYEKEKNRIHGVVK